MILRIATGLARNRAPEHRWRRVAVPVSAAIFMLLVFAGSSVVAMVQRGAERVEQRTALLAKKPSPTDLNLIGGDDVWRGEQYLVVWIEPAGNEEPVLPQGMKRLPEPGQAVVSPGLDRLASDNPELAARYPNRLVLGTEGIYSRNELFAYVRVPEGRHLPEGLAGDLSGDTPAGRVRAFGPPTGADVPYGLQPLSPIPTTGEVLGGVLGFLVVPGLTVLAVGLAAASGVRDRRFEVLSWIGVPGRTLAALAVLETMILALPGLVAVSVLWGLLSPCLEQVPLVGHDAVRGDLGLPWWLLAAELGAGAAMTGLVAILVTTIRRQRGTARPRPGAGRAAISPLRAAPLGVALVLFVLGWPVRGPLGAMLNLGGIVATVAGVPLAFPVALRAVGVALGRLESVPVSIAGRGLEWDPLRAARPFLGIAALLIIALAGSGYIALARYAEASSLPVRGTQTVFVKWLDPNPDDPTRLADALGKGFVVPVREDVSKEGLGLVVGAACQRLASYFPGTKCSPGAPYELPAGMKRKLAEMSGESGSGTKVRLAPRGDVAAGGSALVLDDASPEDLEGRVREAAMRILPAPYVSSLLSNALRVSPLVAWIVGGIVAAVIALAVGCLVSLVDRLLGTHKHRRHLLNLGVSPRRLAALEAWLFAVPYGAVVALSFSAGLAIVALMVGIFPDEALMPWRAIATTLEIAIVAGLVGTASVAFFGARSVRENPE